MNNSGPRSPTITGPPPALAGILPPEAKLSDADVNVIELEPEPTEPPPAKKPPVAALINIFII
jgi:hypothetical protein